MRDPEAAKRRERRLAKLSRSMLERIATGIIAKADGRRRKKRKKKPKA